MNLRLVVLGVGSVLPGNLRFICAFGGAVLVVGLWMYYILVIFWNNRGFILIICQDSLLPAFLQVQLISRTRLLILGDAFIQGNNIICNAGVFVIN